MVVFLPHKLFKLSSLMLALMCFIFADAAMAQSLPESTNVVDLTLSDYIHKVFANNESAQAQMLETEVSHRKEQAETGIFEPEFQASVTREGNARTNTYEEQAAQNGESFFSEQNTIYNGGVQQLIPLGGTIQLGANMSMLDNDINPYASVLSSTNIQFFKQYQTFVGATLTQPLLKDFGFGPTLASIRLAALDSNIAFQEYRKQLMLVISRAETAYWNLYFAQQQLHFYDNSVAVAQNVLDDNQQKLKAGQGSELDVMEARSGLALRQTKRNEAWQSYLDAMGMMRSLTGSAPISYQEGAIVPAFRIVDLPSETNEPVPYAYSYGEAVESNPEYLIQEEKMKQEEVRLGVAKNAALPELDLKAAYGYNGLANTPSESWEVAVSQDFVSWSLGLELTMPLDGNIKARNLKKAAKLSLQEAYLNVKGTQTEIANHLNTAIQQIQAWQESIHSYETVVTYNEELLTNTLQQFKAGAVDGHKALEVEADLLDARQNLANALVQFQEAIIDVEVTDGSILQKWNLDLSREALRERTMALLNASETPHGGGIE